MADLTRSAHSIVEETEQSRKDFRDGKLDGKDGHTLVGLFNVSCRAIGTAINAEKWSAGKALIGQTAR